MLFELKSSVGDKVDIIKASAEDTHIISHSLDLITVAQAFHWFDKQRFKTECKRILHDGGKLAVIFNERCRTEVAQARNEVCMKYCGAYHSGHVHTGYADFDGNIFLKNEYFDKVDNFRVENPYFMTKEQFIGDNLSRSYALSENDEHYADFILELEEVFEKYSRNGIIEQPYLTNCYLGLF